MNKGFFLISLKWYLLNKKIQFIRLFDIFITFLSLAPVTKYLSSGAHAQDQIIRECTLLYFCSDVNRSFQSKGSKGSYGQNVQTSKFQFNDFLIKFTQLSNNNQAFVWNITDCVVGKDWQSLIYWASFLFYSSTCVSTLIFDLNLEI